MPSRLSRFYIIRFLHFLNVTVLLTAQTLCCCHDHVDLVQKLSWHRRGFTLLRIVCLLYYALHVAFIRCLCSYDDLREWPQLLAKGARMIKIDPNYQNATFCSQQVNANHSNPNGCFILNHDDPAPGVVRQTYNTTDNVLALIQEAWAKPYFTDVDRCDCNTACSVTFLVNTCVVKGLVLLRSLSLGWLVARPRTGALRGAGSTSRCVSRRTSTHVQEPLKQAVGQRW